MEVNFFRFKIQFCSLFFLVFLTCNHVKSQEHFDVRIGHVENGAGVFIIDKELVGTVWASFINENLHLNLNFKDVSIRNDQSGYFLIAVDAASRSTARIDLIEERGFLFEAKINQGSYTIICTGCTSTGPDSSNDCIPKKEAGGAWYCTDCSQGTCTKTVSVSTGSIIRE
jgi:hypothetical protein